MASQDEETIHILHNTTELKQLPSTIRRDFDIISANISLSLQDATYIKYLVVNGRVRCAAKIIRDGNVYNLDWLKANIELEEKRYCTNLFNYVCGSILQSPKESVEIINQDETEKGHNLCCGPKTRKLFDVSFIFTHRRIGTYILKQKSTSSNDMINYLHSDAIAIAIYHVLESGSTLEISMMLEYLAKYPNDITHMSHDYISSLVNIRHINSRMNKEVPNTSQLERIITKEITRRLQQTHEPQEHIQYTCDWQQMYLNKTIPKGTHIILTDGHADTHARDFILNDGTTSILTTNRRFVKLSEILGMEVIAETLDETPPDKVVSEPDIPRSHDNPVDHVGGKLTQSLEPYNKYIKYKTKYINMVGKIY
jgi:hypothetical protein